MSNNGSNVGFGMEKSINEMLGILIESTTIFSSSLRVFTQSSELWAQSIEKPIMSPNMFSLSIDKWA